MKSLSVAVLLEDLHRIKNSLSKDDWNAMRVVVGDDDELNGIHIAWGLEVIVKDEEQYDFWLDSAYGGAEKVLQENKYTLFIG